MSTPIVVTGPLDSPDMAKTPGERLREAREKAGYDSGRSAAVAMGWKESTYNAHERAGAPGARNYDLDDARRYGSAYGVSPIWLLTGVNPREPTSEVRKVKVIGYVGAGNAAHHYVSDHIDEVEPPPNYTPKMVAVRVRGHSMEGMFDDGSLLFYEDEPGPMTDAMIGKLCVVWLDDDRVLVKRVVPSRIAGRFDLLSVTEGAILGVEVLRAARVKFIQPA